MKKFFISTACAIALCSTMANAAESPWFETDGARIRLISLPATDGKTINAGLQIELQKGWKTYWRSPGGSGLPPQLDFGQSRNVASTKLTFPIPTTFRDGKTLTAGYKTSVTFPIDIEPLFPNRPVEIELSGMIGICADICVPVQFQLKMKEDGRSFSSAEVASALLQARDNLFQPSSVKLKIEQAQYVQDDEPHLRVTAKVPMATTTASLFVEGPTNWYLTPVRASEIKEETATFEVDLSDIPKSSNPTDIELRISLVANGKGVEQYVTPTK